MALPALPQDFHGLPLVCLPVQGIYPAANGRARGKVCQRHRDELPQGSLLGQSAGLPCCRPSRHIHTPTPIRVGAESRHHGTHLAIPLGDDPWNGRTARTACLDGQIRPRRVQAHDRPASIYPGCVRGGLLQPAFWSGTCSPFLLNSTVVSFRNPSCFPDQRAATHRPPSRPTCIGSL